MGRPFAREEQPVTELQLTVGVSKRGQLDDIEGRARGVVHAKRLVPEIRSLAIARRYPDAVIDLAAPPGISVHDHVIVCKSGHASFNGMLLI